MKPILLILYSLVFFNFTSAQQIIINSLTTVLEKENNPIEKIDLHLGLARAYAFSKNQIEGEKNIDLALAMSKKHQWKEATIAAYLFKAVSELNKGSGSQVLYEYIQKAIKLANEIDSKSGLAFANYHLAEYYIFDKSNPQKGLEVLEEALKKIDHTVPHKHIGNIYKTQGAAHDYLGNKKLVLESYQKALAHFEKVKTNPSIVERLGRKSAMDADDGKLNASQILIYLSDIYTHAGEFEKAFLHSEQAISNYQSLRAYNQGAWAIQTRAYTYEVQGDLERAINGYQEAIKIYEKNQNLFRLIGVQLSVGDLFFRNEDYDSARENFENAKTNSLAIKDSVYLIRALGRIGRTALSQGETEVAMKILNEALAINDKLGIGGERYDLLTKLSDVYQAKKDYTQAINLSKEALQLNRKTKAFRHIQKNLTDLAQLFSQKNQIDSALFYGNLALENSEQYASVQQKIALQRVIANINEKAGNYKTALAHHKMYFDLFKKTYDERAQALLKNEEVRQDVAGVEAEKKQAELTADLLASRNQLYIILAIALGFILLLGSYLFFQLRKTKQQLENQNQQLQQLNATKDKFFGIIAHDIRSPIVALDGVGEQMEYYLKKNKPEKLERLASRVDSTAKRLSALLDNLLNWALLQQGVIPYHPKSLNVSEVGENIFEMFQNNANSKNITLQLQINKNLKVHADESALNTILRNLVSNAIKFTPEGGTVSLSTETMEDKVFININDTGTGISAEKISKLFSLEKKSEKGTAGEKGTGLGLTLVKELTELNKGSIAVNSVLEKGSSFRIGLPMMA